MNMQKKKRVVVGMSGGVDSSVAAALLIEQGYEVIGITMKTYDYSTVGGNINNDSSCCSLTALYDAQHVATKLGIPHYIVDFHELFEEKIISNFISEYLIGRTPNPCVLCNRDVKWGVLLQKAEALGADYIATGHYAQIKYNSTTQRYCVARGVYNEKDQSYALWAVKQEALARTLFPLGTKTKPEVRTLAEQYGLRTAKKSESFEVCFIPDNNYSRFLKERVPDLEHRVDGGNIVYEGTIVGRHAGYPFYTIGQRRNIGAYGKKMYVTGIDSRTNTVFIGTKEDLLHTTLLAKNVNWMSKCEPNEEIEGTAKVRYKDEPSPALLKWKGSDLIEVHFIEPKRAITPGQSVVFYENDEIVCGGIIDKVIK